MRHRTFSGFLESDFEYFSFVKRANRSRGGHPIIRRTEDAGHEVRARFSSLADLLLPGVRRLIPDITHHVGGLGAGRFSRTLFLAFYRRRASHPARDLQLALELGEPGLRVALRFGAKQNDPELASLRSRFFQKLNDDPSAVSALRDLLAHQFVLKSDGQKVISVEEYLSSHRGRIERIFSKDEVLARGAALAEDVAGAFDRLFSLYRYALETQEEVELGIIESFMSFASSRGFVFPLDLVVTVFAALATRPLLILSGVSGTGKTKLAQLISEFLCGPFAHNPRVAFVPVRPDWLDPRSLLGFHDLLHDRYEPTPFIELLVHAQEDDAPHFAIFDEMNLARPEYFLADVLSALESRRYDASGRLVTQASFQVHSASSSLRLVDLLGRDKELPRALALPPNVYMIGTLNLDEASFALSPRLYDRANVIEMPAPSITDLFNATEALGGSLSPGASRSQRERFSRGGFYTGPVALSTPLAGRDELISALTEAHQALSSAGYPVGARSARDAFSFAAHTNALGGAPWRWSLDRHILLRLVPRLLSQLPLSQRALWALLYFCAGAQKEADAESLLEDNPASWSHPNAGAAIQSALLRQREEELLR